MVCKSIAELIQLNESIKQGKGLDGQPISSREAARQVGNLQKRILSNMEVISAGRNTPEQKAILRTQTQRLINNTAYSTSEVRRRRLIDQLTRSEKGVSKKTAARAADYKKVKGEHTVQLDVTQQLGDARKLITDLSKQAQGADKVALDNVLIFLERLEQKAAELSEQGMGIGEVEPHILAFKQFDGMFNAQTNQIKDPKLKAKVDAKMASIEYLVQEATLQIQEQILREEISVNKDFAAKYPEEKMTPSKLVEEEKEASLEVAPEEPEVDPIMTREPELKELKVNTEALDTRPKLGSNVSAKVKFYEEQSRASQADMKSAVRRLKGKETAPAEEADSRITLKK